MSEAKQPTPEQQAQQVQRQQQTDEAQIRGQFVATDALEQFNDVLDGFGFGSDTSLFGRTNFENAPLNAMLDLLDSANPADLEAAGNTLENATKALNEAARELSGFVTTTDWQGEGAEEFRRYGSELVTYAYGLGTFANAVGAQMKVASTGLASVRNSKPPRDGRLVQKKPEDFALPERTGDNPDYQKALQVEKDRQEAINQMNRLASFYAVSEGTLAAQEPPRPPRVLNVEVPKPLGEFNSGRATEVGPAPADLARTAVAQPGASRTESVAGGEGRAPAESLGKAAQAVAPSPSMVVDSVAAPAAPAAPPGTAQPPSATGTSVTGNAAVPPVVGNLGTSVRGTAPRAGAAGVPRAGGSSGATAVGRPGTTGGGSSAVGRATGAAGRPGMPGVAGGGTGAAVGRPGATGPGAAGRPGVMGPGAGAVGQAGATGGRGQTPMAGRPGMAGQTVAGRPGSPAGARGGRMDGIVGGTPQRTAGGTTGSRIPRGTVIGGETAATGRSSAARPGQSGVVGAQQAGAVSRPTGRGTPSVNGVVGTPAGGTASTGGRAGRQQLREEEQERTGTPRPDYLTEDEETWTARRRGAVPPVIG